MIECKIEAMKKIVMVAATVVLTMTSTVLISCVDNIDNLASQQETNLDDQTDYTLKQVSVNRNGQSAGIVTIRFYDDMPNVPYISVSDFQNVVSPGSTVTVTKIGTGLYLLSNAGSTATVSTISETCAFDDYMAFTNLMGQVQQGMENGYYDGYPFIRFSYQTLSGGSPAVTFDYAPYGINLRGDDAAVYFPFTTLADLYADLFGHYVACNGEKVVYVNKDGYDQSGIEGLDEDFAVENLLKKSERNADMIAYNYAELCFVIDHFYGMPTGSTIETSILNIGLDKTLEADAIGQTVKNLLLSSDKQDYIGGLDMLNAFLGDRGHTSMCNLGNYPVVYDSTFEQKYPDLYEFYLDRVIIDEVVKFVQINDVAIPQRTRIFGDENTYHKQGNTAICHFDSFAHTDINAWNAFYNGVMPRPTLETSPDDPIAIFLDALDKADKDPEVKNLVIDLTINRGGSADVVVAMTSLLFGQSFFRVSNIVTEQRTTWYYDVDRNFDGKFDETDNDVHYDLNFCILTSPMSFSCGNLFPELCKEAGLLIAGQKSGGGSCGIGGYRTADGFYYRISSARGHLADENWHSIDGGVTPNVVIDYAAQQTVDYFGRECVIYSYQNFYDFQGCKLADLKTK